MQHIPTEVIKLLAQNCIHYEYVVTPRHTTLRGLTFQHLGPDSTLLNLVMTPDLLANFAEGILANSRQIKRSFAKIRKERQQKAIQLLIDIPAPPPPDEVQGDGDDDE